MDFDALAAVFFDPALDRHGAPDLPTSAARRLRDALEPIATQGWWAREVHEHPALAELGFFETYVWGRAASLGEPSAEVVVAAFGVFEPRLVTSAYQAGRATVSRLDVLAAREGGAAASLRRVLGAHDVTELAEVLLRAVEPLAVTARPLFGSLRALPVPEDPYGRLWRAAELVREHRGDGHLAACVTAGLDPVASNLLTELWVGYPVGEYTASRGFDQQRIAEALDGLERRGWVADGRLTAAGRAARGAVEEDTDRTQEGLVSRLADRLDEVVAEAERLSAMLLAAAATPTDPRKRAAG